MNIFVLALIFTPVFLLLAVRRNRRQRSDERSETTEVEVNDKGAFRVLADGRREEVDWDEVVEVDVFIARKGPHRRAGGALVLYGTNKRGCVIPLDRIESSGVLVHLSRLEGLKISNVVAALRVDETRESDLQTNPLRSVTPKPWQTTTVCWVREGHEGFARPNVGSDPTDPSDSGFGGAEPNPE